MNHDKISCLQCYSFGKSYLFPSNYVLAVIPFRKETKLNDRWLLGESLWLNQRVPLINLSLENREVEPIQRAYIIVVKSYADNQLYPLGFITAEIPKTVDLQEGDLRWDGEQDRHLYPVMGKTLSGKIVDFIKLNKQLEPFLKKFQSLELNR